MDHETTSDIRCRNCGDVYGENGCCPAPRFGADDPDEYGPPLALVARNPHGTEGA